MASSPLSMFRKYQFAFLVGFGCLLMFSFVVAPPLQEYLQSRAAEGANPVVMQYEGGKVRVADLQRLRATHYRTHDILQRLLFQTQSNGGSPKTMGLRRLSSDRQLLEMVLLSTKAEKMGMQASDQAIRQYLLDWTDQTVSGDDVVKTIRDAGLTEAAFFQQVGVEMLAQRVDALATSGSLMITPAALWQNFNRVNRKISAEVLPVKVADFVDQVEADPSDTELRAFFEQYRAELPNPNLPEPGFMQPYRAAFGYVKADFDQFLDRAKSQVTEEQIQQEYQRRVDNGQYRRLIPADDPSSDAPSPNDRPPAPRGIEPPPVINPPAEDADGQDGQQPPPPVINPPGNDQSQPPTPAERSGSSRR